MKFRAIRDITADDLFGDLVKPEQIGEVRIKAGTIGEETYCYEKSREVLFEGQVIDWSFRLDVDYIEEVEE
jgi:hypothetical protein